MGRTKLIENPERLWDLFLQYKESAKKNPIIVKDWVGKDAEPVYREKERPLTVEGFENYLEDNDIINNLSNYFANSDNRYDDYSTICARIRRNVREDQIAGGMVGIYNPSITQRLNNLVERNDHTSDGQKLNPIFKVEIVEEKQTDESDSSI